MKKRILFFLILAFPILLGSNTAQGLVVPAIPVNEPNTNIQNKPSSISNANTFSEASDSLTPKAYSIGDLLVLDNLFDGEYDLLDSGWTSLGDLLVLNEIFNQHGINSPQNDLSLGDLFVLDELLDSSNMPTLDKGHSSISDLLILDRLFNR